jgi:hypothetical protein
MGKKKRQGRVGRPPGSTTPAVAPGAPRPWAPANRGGSRRRFVIGVVLVAALVATAIPLALWLYSKNKPTLTTAAGSGQPSRAAPAYVKSDPQIVYAVAALLVQQKQWKRALPHAQKLVELTPGQVGPRQLVENIRRQLAAVPAPR